MTEGNGLQSVSLRDILGETMTRDEAVALLKASTDAYEIFSEFSENHQEEVLEFMQGVRGLPILYDGFYRYVFDPERHPERLEGFLSNLFDQEVAIEEVLSREGNKLVEDGSLVVMDIIVKLSDGSIVDVEMQKCGYMFTGERSSCYISDMIMRQYNRIKAKEKKKFKFSHMKPVYLIVLMERSTKEFRKVSPAYIHRLQNNFDSAVSLNLLSNLTYISLDTFHEVSQNIDNQLEAWLTFLSSDQPEDMIRLVKKYPEFMECYHDIRMFRQKPEELIHMFSEALIQMDKNTVQYMVEEQQKELEEQWKKLKEQKEAIEEQQQEIKERKQEIEEQKQEIEEQKQEIEEQKQEIDTLKAQNNEKDALIALLQEKLEKQMQE